MTTPASTRPRVVVLLAAVVLALLLLLARAIDARADDSAGSALPQAPVIEAPAIEAPFIEYKVRSGDTLWAIASGHVAPGDDVRVLVEDIRSASGLDTSVIHPGQVLLIPVGG